MNLQLLPQTIAKLNSFNKFLCKVSTKDFIEQPFLSAVKITGSYKSGGEAFFLQNTRTRASFSQIFSRRTS